MSKYYSKTTCGFYDPAINASMPPDAVEVTDVAYEALFAAQSAGQIISADSNGNPVAAPPPGPTAAQLWARYQAQAQALLVKSDMVAIRCQKASVAFPAAWLTYVQALRAIMDASSGDPTQALPAQPAYPAGT